MSQLRKSALQNVQIYIKNNLEENLSLSKLAQQANLSTFHFFRLFKRSTGKTPYRYVLNERLHKAKVLLISSDENINQIAFKTGFGSASKFITRFKSLLGVTPKQYRGKFQ